MLSVFDSDSIAVGAGAAMVGYCINVNYGAGVGFLIGATANAMVKYIGDDHDDIKFHDSIV